MSTTGGLNGDFVDRGPAVFAVTTATLVLSTVFVAARLYCRYFIVNKVSWDDKIILLAWLLAFGLSFTIDYGAKLGLGRHDVNIDPGNVGSLRRCEYVFSILYNPALMATKTSILIFYLRLSKNTQKVLRFASWMTLGIVNVAGAVLTLLNIFQCRPVDAAWETWRTSAQCLPLLTEFICAAPINIVTDLAILALPIPVLTGMRLPPRQKAILVFTFTLGIFVTIVDVVRIYYLQQAVTAVPTGLSTDPNAQFGGQEDFAWNAALSFMWSAVEVNVGMTCACIPTLKPLVVKILPAMLYDPDGTRGSSLTQSKDYLDSPSRNAGSDVPVSPTIPQPVARGGNGQEAAQANGSDDNEEVSALDFLTTPDMNMSDLQTRIRKDTGHRLSASRTANTNSTVAARNNVYFGFVNMSKPKSMLRCNAAESFRYCTVVTILFLLWGVAYGLLNTLNNVVAAVSGMTPAQTLGLTSAYFGGGYFFGPLLVGEWVLRRDEHHRTWKKKDRHGAESVGGFKVTFILGLCFYGIGTIIFWPSAVTNSFGGFMLSNFVVGFGLSILETGANAFLILCGPPQYGETRLCLAQGVQGVGSVLAGLLAQKVFFTSVATNGTTNSMTLLNVQWTYLAITMLCVLLALFFYYMPLPEVSDNELQASADRLPVDPQKRSLGGLQLRTWCLILAIVAQWTYVACQECNSIFVRSLLVSILPRQENAGTDAVNGDTNPGENSDKPPGLDMPIPDYLLIAHTAFAVSRFMVAYLTYLSVSNPRIPKPRTILSICVGLSVFFALLTVVLHPQNPNLLLIPIVLFYFSEGPCWPLIFAMGLRGQGRRTKRAAAFITMGGSGATFFPFVVYAIIVNGGTVQLAFVVIVALQVATGFYPLFLATIRDAREMTDPGSLILNVEGNTAQEEMDINAQMLARKRRSSTAMAMEKGAHLMGKLATLGKGHRRTVSSVSPAAVVHAEVGGLARTRSV